MAGECRVTRAEVNRFVGRRRFRSVKSRTDPGEFGGAAGICQETEVTDAAEAFWQDVKEKAADKLVGVKRHYLGFVAGAIVLPTEADVATLARQEPAVGDGDAMGIAAQIIEDLLRPAEGTFGVNDPVDFAERLQIAGESGGFDQPREPPEESKLAGLERRLKALEE